MAESPISPLLIDLDATAGDNAGVSASEPALIPIDQLDIEPAELPKLPDLETSNSESENEEAHPSSAARVSVLFPPNCAICLRRCRKICFTDSCMHQFCFRCLCEWSKIKPECPLCKQTFKYIIHNGRSMHQFEVYHVQPPTVQINHAESSANILETGNVPVRPRIMYPTFIGSLDDPRFHRTNIPIFPSRSDFCGHSGHSAENFNMDTFSWRCVIYSANLYALPICDITGRFRESSARFYRDIPSEMHRLIPFINRDVSILLRNSRTSVTRVMKRVHTYLLSMNISSSEFRRRINRYLGGNTSHFIHELNNFARSPYDMIDYDRVVRYMRRNYYGNQNMMFSSTSSESSDDDIRAGRQAASEAGEHGAVAAAESPHVDNSSNSRPPTGYPSFSVNITAEGAEVSGLSMVGQSAAINLNTHNRATAATAAQNAAPLEIIELDDEPEQIVDLTVHEVPEDEPPRHAELTITHNIDLAESSSDCESVLARKPQNLRAPEMVSLNSESDSDVVFVAEQKPELLSTVETAQKSSNNSAPTPRSRQSGYDGLFMGASTSKGVSAAPQGKRATRKSARKRINTLKISTDKNDASVVGSSKTSSDSDEDCQVLKSKRRNNKPTTKRTRK